LLRTLNGIETSVDSGSAVEAVNRTPAKKVEPPSADDAGLFAIWSNLKPNTQKYGRRWIADGCPKKFHPGEHDVITESLKPLRIAAAKASAAQRKRFLELSESYEVVS
jgi:hypothetical protein